MRHEVFALKNLTIKNAYMTSLDSFTMHISEGQTLGILCSDVKEKTALLNLFEGQYTVSGKMVYFAGEPKKKQVTGHLFRKFFLVAGDAHKVLPSLSVIDNIMMDTDRMYFLMNSRKTRAMAESLLDEFSLSVPLDIPVEELTTAQKYLVEILRAFVQKRKIIVLTNLNDRVIPKEMNQIFILIRQMITRGMTFLFMIDTPDARLIHEMDELLIIRHGRDIAQMRSDILHYSELQNYMLTGSLEAPAIHISSANKEHSFDPYVFENSFDSMEEKILYSFDEVRTDRLHRIDFSLMPGELIKLICVDQNSIDAFSALLHGLTPLRGGAIRLHDRNCHFRSLSEAIEEGLYWCPEGPYENLVLENLSLIDNLLLGPMTKAGKTRITSGLRENMSDYCRQYFPDTDPNLPVLEMNDILRQELAYRKILLQAPKLLFIEKPFEETILGMNQITLQIISELQRRGTAVVILSMSLKDAEMLDGDTIYLRDGREIDEMEMYELMY